MLPEECSASWREVGGAREEYEEMEKDEDDEKNLVGHLEVHEEVE